ncbi:MAG: imidazole glycerol phosphate synthase subunit HisH [Ruminococcaceae bacterium]|nr:imidazole glycerol phosphate synthase subunit HisH [Oscillospiraceae bacterium]
MIAIIDYGVGNLFSLSSSFKSIGANTVVTGDPEVIKKAEKLVLPGVGAFSDAAAKLRESGLDKVIIEEVKNGKPLLGICLGMQMLFTESLEYGTHKGLGLIPGSVVPMKGVVPAELKVPHIGWNGLIFPENKPKSKIFKYLNPGDHMYFVHSFYATNCEDYVSSKTEYGVLLTASAENKNVYGVQFHPEKSGEKGLLILKAFCEL